MRNNRKAFRLLQNQSLPIETYEQNGLVRLSVDINQDLQSCLEKLINSNGEYIRIVVVNIPPQGKTIINEDYDLKPVSVFTDDTDNKNQYEISVNGILLYEFSVKLYTFGDEVIPKNTSVTIKHKGKNNINFAFICRKVTITEEIIY